jgi:alanyl-tRNA synthetase
MKSSKEIRNEFIEFFRNKQHVFVPSWPVIPMDDPTLLFTNAGMNQFKDVFLGKGKRNYSRAVNSQRCIRVSGKHNDLEEVGHDTYHHTFFEMLGNWSFGDYYKEDAIRWAWELLTEVWKLPKDKLWATVFRDDDEAAEIWPKVTDISPDRVLRFDEKDNFWEMAETGPCGPCSEIHIDLGEEFCDKKDVPGHTCAVNGDCGRYIELWNLVFIQFHKDENGTLNPLPSKHVDTGMGFERIVSVLQGVYDNYKTDLFVPILEAIANLTDQDYHKAEDKAPFHVIADHIRMLTFAIGDGGMPSNEGRGYVIRRILRRAARYARKLDMHEPFIYKLVPVVVDILGDAFPEIKDRVKFVQQVIKTEEENFNRTLDKGLEIFGGIVEKLKKDGKTQISGKDAFRLYDTYGFPLDLTRMLAEEHHLSIDEDEFDREMEIQRERARKAGKFEMEYNHDENWNVLHHGDHSFFVGYEKMEIETRIMKFQVKDEQTAWIVLEETPFYPEGGGQIGDRGVLFIDGKEIEVTDTRKDGNTIIHVCKWPTDFQVVSGEVKAKVYENRRIRTMYNHTATHLLHAALRKVLGDHVRQAGSLVEPDRLRFDFTHFEKISDADLLKIEEIVNEKIRSDYPVEAVYTTLEEAKKMGAMALFGEKYGEEVRVIAIDDYSKELCGGTHVARTGQIGLFLITQETSVASGIRRIEAVTGPAALEYAQKMRTEIQQLSLTLNVPPMELNQKIKSVTEAMKHLEKELLNLKKEHLLNNIDQILSDKKDIGNVHLVIRRFKDEDINMLKQLGDQLRSKDPDVVAFLFNEKGSKINIVCVVGDHALASTSFKAGDLARQVAQFLGGGGGGRPHMAMAGGTKVEKLPEIEQFIQSILS